MVKFKNSENLYQRKEKISLYVCGKEPISRAHKNDQKHPQESPKILYFLHLNLLK